jgi:hypothetical protein
VALAKGRDAKEMAEGVVGHGSALAPARW